MTIPSCSAVPFAVLLVGCVSPVGLDIPRTTEPLDTLPDEVENVLDDFVLGANLPWLHYGHDFGRAWGDRGVRSDESRPRLEADLDVLIGADVIRWFVFADGRALDNSTPEMVLADLDAALEMAEERGIQLMPVLFDFLWFEEGEVVGGVQVFGRRELAVDPIAREQLIETWIVPIAERYRDDPRIFAFDLINEPEWALSDGPRIPIVAEPVTLGEMEDFIFDVARVLRGGRPLTIGSASFDDVDLLWADAPLDMLQIHHYEVTPLPPVTTLQTELPVFVGEFPTADFDLPSRLEDYERLGYAGALPWSLNGTDAATSRDALADYFGN